ncbi:MAG: hypothetical protein AAGA56_23850 [Myxococcota bacterium]
MGSINVGALLVALALAPIGAGCVQTKAARAGFSQLQARAVFDLGCSPAGLQYYPIDSRTHVVTGCGRRLTYQEDCASVGGPQLECTWRVDTPTSAQQQWPNMAARPRPRRVMTDLTATPRADYPQGYGNPTTIPTTPNEASPRRPFPTELFDSRH